jgi:hypothetical protein
MATPWVKNEIFQTNALQGQNQFPTSPPSYHTISSRGKTRNHAIKSHGSTGFQPENNK